MAKLRSTNIYGDLSVTGDVKISGNEVATQTWVTNTAKAKSAGAADTAAKLATARTIGGVSFDGSANINLPGVNTAGNQNTTGSAAKLTTARTIGGVSFDGSANINLPGVNTAGNQNTTGNAATATKLATSRTLTIGLTGKSFNGSSNVAWSLDDIGALPLTGGTMDGNITMSGSSYINFTSDERLKNKNFKYEELMSNKMLNVPVWNYEFKDNIGEGRIGVMAQDLQREYGDSVNITSEDENGFLSVNLESMLFIMWKSIQELKEENVNLRKKIKEF